MGIRSDVAIAVSKDIKLSETALELLSDADDTYKHSDGTMYHFEDIKWYDTDEEIKGFLAELKEKDPGGENYLIIEACHEYPDLEGAGSTGGWADNPWGIRLNVSVSIAFNA